MPNNGRSSSGEGRHTNGTDPHNHHSQSSSDRSSERDQLRGALQKSSLTNITAGLSNDRSLDDVTYADGCVLLGKSVQADHTYVTRYRIDHAQSRSGINKAILEEECVPCCSEEGKETAKTCFWLFIKSEAFLFSLHMTALAFGVAKEALDVGEISDDLELVHSLIETFVTILMISIRMISGWISYKDLKHKAFDCEHISSDHTTEARGRMIRRWRNMVTSMGAVLIAISIICFLLFYYLIHLGWTILSNNFCMIVFTVVSGLYTARVNTSAATIKADQQKTVFFEALLLLQENINAHKSGRSAEFNTARSDLFLRSVEETAFLEKPDHITMSPEVQTAPMFNMWRAMELQDMA